MSQARDRKLEGTVWSPAGPGLNLKSVPVTSSGTLIEPLGHSGPSQPSRDDIGETLGKSLPSWGSSVSNLSYRHECEGKRLHPEILGRGGEPLEKF